MTIPELNFISSTFYKVLIAGILLFLFFRVICYVFKLFIKNKKQLKTINRFLPLIEMLIWILFIVRALGVFIESNQLLAIGVSFILLFILFWIFKYSIKNLIAGVLFKLSGHFSLDDLLQAGDYSGRIKKFGLHSIELETESGKSIFIPYSTILEKVNIRLDTTEIKTAYIFIIDVPKRDNENKLIEEIRRSIISLPWISVKLMPQIKLIAKTDTHFSFEISIHAISKSYLVKTEKYLQEKYGDSN